MAVAVATHELPEGVTIVVAAGASVGIFEGSATKVDTLVGELDSGDGHVGPFCRGRKRTALSGTHLQICVSVSL